MAVAYLDTQIAIWIHDRHFKKLTKDAVRLIESRDLLLSPMAYLELEYVNRLHRVNNNAVTIYARLHSSIGLTLCGLPFATVADFAIQNGWTSDPFDKIIAAQARANQNAPLITSDENIRKHYAQAVW